MSRPIKLKAWDGYTETIQGVREIDYQYNRLWLTNDEKRKLEGDENVVLLQFTGLKDKNGVEIYEGDGIEASWGYVIKDGYRPVSIYRGVVKFGEYEQDASGGEYDQESCIGFYGEFSQGADSDEEFSKLDSHDYEKEQSLLKFAEIEIIGNIYQNPELLEQSND